MIIHITPLGIAAETNGKINFIRFSESLEDAGVIFYKILKGDKDLINRFLGRYKDALKTTSYQLYNQLQRMGWRVELVEGKTLSAPQILVESGLARNEKEAVRMINEAMIGFTTIKLREEMTNKDLLIIHAINAYDEYTETINLFYERLREWYGVYFPELSDLITKIDSYTNLIYNFLSRERFRYEDLLKYGYSEERARNISEAAKNSLGGLLSREDLEIIRQHAEELKNLITKRDYIEDYLKETLESEAPNITALVGHKLAARLIAKAGGLRKLASYPASTIQLLGAEKSLFIALRKGGKPPKHGLIFQHPFINQSPKVIRGKVARLLASKIAIAARVDAFGGDFIGDKLYEEVKKRVEELRKQAPGIMEKKRKIKKEFRRRGKRKKRRRRG